MYQVFWYIFKHWKITKQTIYFKYNVYCSSFTKELPRLPPWKNQKWMKLCHILCHICGTCGTPIKCATLCGTCKWDPLDNCNFILYHSWWKVDPFLLLRLLMFWEWFVLNQLCHILCHICGTCGTHIKFVAHWGK